MGLFTGRRATAPSEPFTWTNTGLTPGQLALLALAGPYQRGTGAVDTLADPEASGHGRRGVDRRIAQAWGIVDRPSALAMIASLAQGMHAPVFDAVGEPAAMLAHALGTPDEPAARERCREEVARRLAERARPLMDELRTTGRHERLQKAEGSLDLEVGQRQQMAESFAELLRSENGNAIPYPLPHTIWAWDIGRAANLVRIQHALGRLGEEESWQLLVELGQQAARHHGSWAEYGMAHLAGRAFWLFTQGGTDRVDGEMKLGRETIDMLLGHPQGPWGRVPWVGSRPTISGARTNG